MKKFLSSRSNSQLSIFASSSFFLFLLLSSTVLFQNCGGFTPLSVSNLASSIPQSGPAAHLTWDVKPGEQDSFSVEASLDTANFVEILKTDGNTGAAIIYGLSKNQVYYFRVRAINQAGASNYSTIITAKVP